MTFFIRVAIDRKIELPECVIQKMDLSVNDELVAEIKDNKLTLSKKEENHVRHFKGSHKDLWKNTDTEEYLKDEGTGADSSGY